jgi:hypothetical protein
MEFPTPKIRDEAPAKEAGSVATRPYAQASRDPRALGILAKTIYREMRQGGLVEEDVMSVAGELLSLVAGDMKDRRSSPPEQPTPSSPRRR